MKCLTFEIFTHKTPNPRWGGVGLIFCYYFSRQFMTFPGLLIFWPPKIEFPLRPPLVGGGKKIVIDFLNSSWKLPDFWNLDPHPPPLEPPPPPRVGWVKTNCIDFLDSSWHFPDFWFFDPPKIPTATPFGGGGGKFFVSIFSTVHEIYRTFENLTPNPPLDPPGWDG